MPLSVWAGLLLPELTPTCMTLELVDCSVSKPIGIAKDVSFKVRVFHFPADFVDDPDSSKINPFYYDPEGDILLLEAILNSEPSPPLPNQEQNLPSFKEELKAYEAQTVKSSVDEPLEAELKDLPHHIERCFLKTSRALIDVHKGELTLRIGNEAITYNLDQTVRYTANYNQMSANKINVVESACDEYSQEVLGFSNVTDSGMSTPQNDLIVSVTSPTLTPFGDSDFLLFEEADAFIGLEDDPDSSKINPFYYDPEGDILLLEAILNSEPSPPPPNQGQNLPSFKEELKAYEAQIVKSSIDEPPEVKLKDLPHHLDYAFLEGDNKLPIIIAKELRSEEKAALIKVLKSHKQAIAWKLSDIQGINTEFCTHKIIMEEDYKLPVQHQRQVNPKIHDVIKKEVEKLLDAGLIYPISDSPWVSLVCIDYHGFSGYFQITIDPRDQEKKTFTAHMALLPTAACLSACAMLRALFIGDAKDRLLRWVLLLQEFDFKVLDTKGAENLAADKDPLKKIR
nr:hypothetical protein [Tanacetum cinerariifolium]